MIIPSIHSPTPSTNSLRDNPPSNYIPPGRSSPSQNPRGRAVWIGSETEMGGIRYIVNRGGREWVCVWIGDP